MEIEGKPCQTEIPYQMEIFLLPRRCECSQEALKRGGSQGDGLECSRWSVSGGWGQSCRLTEEADVNFGEFLAWLLGPGVV